MFWTGTGASDGVLEGVERSTTDPCRAAGVAPLVNCASSQLVGFTPLLIISTILDILPKELNGKINFI